MLPFDPKNLPPVYSPSIGPPTGFGENFLEAFEVQRKVESQRAVPLALQRRFVENLERARDLSGEELDLPANLFDQQWTEILEAQLAGKEWKGMALSFEREAATQFNELMKKLEELRLRHPEIKTFKEIQDEVVAELTGLREEQGQVSARADWKGWLGTLAGGMAGSFDPTTDPINFGSLFAPGAGATWYGRVLVEAAIGAVTEAGVQFGFVQKRQKSLGIEPVNPWASIALAGAGAAAFRGIAFEGAPAAFRAGERIVAPQRQRARTFSSAMDEALRLPSDRAPRPEELLAAARRVPQTPEVRAAQYAFELEQMTLRDIGDTSPEGFRQWRVEVEDAVRTVEGMEPSPTRAGVEQATTAPQVLSESGRAQMRREQPELARELDEVEARISELETTLPSTTGLGEVGQAGAAISDNLHKMLWRKVREGKTTENRQPSAILQAAKIVRDAGGLQDARAFRDFTQEFAGIERGPNFQQEMRALVRRHIPVLTRAGVAVPTKTEPPPPRASEIAEGGRTKAVAEAEEVSVLAEAVEAQAEAWFERAQVARGEGEAPPVGAEVRPTSIDIGTDRNIDLDQLIDLVDENGLVIQRTVREIMDDLAEDTKLVKESERCLL